MKLYFLLIPLLWFSITSIAQKGERIKYEASDGSLESGVRNGERYQKLIKNVLISQQGTKIYCDTAYLFRVRNVLEAYGRIRVVDGDSVTITSERLIFYGDSRVAELRGNVIYREGNTTTLYTDVLDYDMINKSATYFDGGKLIDPTTTLTSVFGYYDTQARYMSFKDNVILVDPEYTLESDTLQYDLNDRIAYFKGPTTIISSDSAVLEADDGGQYKTLEKQSEFLQTEIETESYILRGETLKADDISKAYQATVNAELIAKKDSIIITGDIGRYWKQDGIGKVHERALMRKLFNEDTLYLIADTLVSYENLETGDRFLFATGNVKMYKSDLQGVADSIAYYVSDSVMYMYNDPVLWNGENQIEADSINIEIAHGEIDKMNLKDNAFIISEDVLTNYNQIKGRQMTSFFKNNELHQVDVYGNGETLYFALEEDSLFSGLNKVVSSILILKFVDNQVRKHLVFRKCRCFFHST